MMNFCDSCKYWDFTHEGGMDKFGMCTHDTVPDMLRIVDEEDLDEPALFTAATFGCIYHKGKGLSLAVTAIHVNKNK